MRYIDPRTEAATHFYRKVKRRAREEGDLDDRKSLYKTTKNIVRSELPDYDDPDILDLLTDDQMLEHTADTRGEVAIGKLLRDHVKFSITHKVVDDLREGNTDE